MAGVGQGKERRLDHWRHAKVEQLDAREGETSERLIYLEGLIAGARAQASASQPRLDRPDKAFGRQAQRTRASPNAAAGIGVRLVASFERKGED